MVKKLNIPMISMKFIFSLSIVQLMFICMLILPSEGHEMTLKELALLAEIPQMLFMSALTAALAPVCYITTDKYIEKIKK